MDGATAEDNGGRMVLVEREGSKAIAVVVVSVAAV
jgi:hypothetical protein